jgi:hypothetical protein
MKKKRRRETPFFFRIARLRLAAMNCLLSKAEAFSKRQF